MSSTISSDQKKSLAISSLLYGIMLLILFFIRFWPPANLDQLTGGGGGGGVTINFGDSDLGSGANYKSEVLEVKHQAKQVPSKTTPDEAILSQENTTEESVVIPTKEKTKKPVVVVKKEEPKPVVITKPKVSSSTNNALASIMKGSNRGGDGDDKTAGNKGKSNGNLNSNDYYGVGGSGGGTGGGNGTGNGTGTGPGSGSGSGGGSGSGSGGGTGYAMGNRKAIYKPKPNSDCSNETGTVVVEVTVDKNGNTTSAISGIKGTTITAKCLKDQAKMAAMNTKWQPSDNAPEKQVGKITYNFSFKQN